MGKTQKTLLIGITVLLATGCGSFGIDKDRSAERRKNDLCGEVGTHDLAHCTSYGTGLQEDAIESTRRWENPPPTKEQMKQAIIDRVNSENAQREQNNQSDSDND